jgi:hypothetical protein
MIGRSHVAYKRIASDLGENNELAVLNSTYTIRVSQTRRQTDLGEGRAYAARMGSGSIWGMWCRSKPAAVTGTPPPHLPPSEFDSVNN